MGVESHQPQIMFKALVIGPERSGKTTFVKSLQRIDNFLSMPTIGCACEMVDMETVRYCLLDHGGQECLKRHWQRFYDQCDVIIFVFDADDDDVTTAVQELVEVAVVNKQKSFLVIANQRDVEMSGSGKTEMLESEIKRARTVVDDKSLLHLAQCNVSDVTDAIKQFKVFVKLLDKSIRKQRKTVR